MDAAHYYRSLSQELAAVKSRVRQLIQTNHWQTDGEWKESVLRSVLRRHVPSTVGVGRGFIVGPRQASSQIDVLLYDTSFPLLHQDGDLVFITPDAVRGIIEVKSTLRTDELTETLTKLADNAELLRDGAKRIFLGLFAYEHVLGINGRNRLFSALQDVAVGQRRRAVNHICAGSCDFYRFWANDPETKAQRNEWAAYSVDEMAWGYFIFNALEISVGETVKRNIWAWFPRDGKEIHKRGTAPLLKAVQTQ